MLAAFGQLAAVFVGIPSLIYLTFQIREQTKERRQSAVHAFTVQWGDLTGSLHDNPETAAIFLRGMHSFTDLDALSKLRFSALFNRLINIFEGMYFSHRQRILTGSSWRAVERTMSVLIAHPAFNNGGKLENIGTPKSLTISSASSSQKAISPRLSPTYNLGDLFGPKAGT